MEVSSEHCRQRLVTINCIGFASVISSDTKHLSFPDSLSVFVYTCLRRLDIRFLNSSFIWPTWLSHSNESLLFTLEHKRNNLKRRLFAPEVEDLGWHTYRGAQWICCNIHCSLLLSPILDFWRRICVRFDLRTKTATGYMFIVKRGRFEKTQTEF